MVDNFIQNNPQNGVYCTNSSNPILGYYNYNTYGNNITGNACGVFCWNNSSPILGNNSPVNGGSNNLDNTSWNLYSLYSGVVLAADNWWGNTNPSYFKISTTGSVTYSPYQHSPMLVPQPPLSKSGENLYASVSCDIPLLDQLNKANELIVENNLEQARNICLNLVKNYPDYSVSYNALNLIKDTYPASEINS